MFLFDVVESIEKPLEFDIAVALDLDQHKKRFLTCADEKITLNGAETFYMLLS